MSVTTEKQEEKKVKLPPLPTRLITRNNVAFPFVSTEGLRDTLKGLLYLSPAITPENFAPVEGAKDEAGNLIPSFLLWSGNVELAKKTKAMFNAMSQVCWKDAVEKATDPDTGIVDQDKVYQYFEENISSWGVKGESTKQLEERIEEVTTLINELGDIADLEDPNEIAKVDFMAGKATDVGTFFIEFRKKLKEYTGEIKTLQAQIESKKRPRKDKAESAE